MDKELRMEPGDTHRRGSVQNDEAIDLTRGGTGPIRKGKGRVQRRESELKKAL